MFFSQITFASPSTSLNPTGSPPSYPSLPGLSWKSHLPAAQGNLLERGLCSSAMPGKGRVSALHSTKLPCPCLGLTYTICTTGLCAA